MFHGQEVVDIVDIYEQQIQSAIENKQKLQNELNAIPDALIDMQKFQTALTHAQNPCLTWKNGTWLQKRRLVHAVFKDKPKYYRKNGFQIATTPWIFSKKPCHNDAGSILVETAGVFFKLSRMPSMTFDARISNRRRMIAKYSKMPVSR
jgi:hypothetical protein